MELERKWRILYRGFTILPGTEPQRLVQTYLPVQEGEHRIRTDGTTYWETWKGDGTIARTETEREITAEEYARLFSPELPTITKDRYTFPEDNFTWIVDICTGELEGLILLELEPREINTADADVEQVAAALNAVAYPIGFGQGIEVTYDARYKAKNLARHGIPPLEGAA